jgi:hypothetical protein
VPGLQLPSGKQEFVNADAFLESVCNGLVLKRVFRFEEARLTLPGHLNCQNTSSYSIENPYAFDEVFLAKRKSKCGGHMSSENNNKTILPFLTKE